MSNTKLTAAEEKLAAALKEFDEATAAFRRTRCYAYKVHVDIATKRLLDASDVWLQRKHGLTPDWVKSDDG